MFTKRLATYLLVMVLVAICCSPSLADRRQLAWTYQYHTMPAGGAELEHYFGYKLNDKDFPEKGSFSQQIEIELGLTNRWDISLYQMFSQENGSDFEYDGLKLRTRYRLFNAGQYPVDPLLYLEVKRPAEHTEKTVVEGKLVLARDFNRFFSAFNLVVERELGTGFETEWKYDIGLGYEFSPAFSIALESKGNYKTGDDGKQSFGPTVSYAKGSVWFTTGVLFPTTIKASDFELRYILGIYL